MSDVEEQARKEGWVPKEEWSGPEEQWKPAEQFVEDGQKINGILRSKVEKLEQKIASQTDTLQKVTQFAEKAVARETRQKEAALRKLEALRKQAIEDGDGETFTRAEDGINKLRSNMAQEQPSFQPQPQETSPAGQEWLANNPWYGKDPVATAYAERVAESLQMRGYTEENQAFFEKVDESLRFEPDIAKRIGKTRPASPVEGDTTPVQAGKQDWSALPPDARKECEQFMRDIPGFTKEQYLSQYDWES